MQQRPQGFAPMTSLSQGSMQVFSPTRSVITDMIMVQFISMIVIFGLILVLKGGSLSANSVSAYLIGIMVSSLILGRIYTRLTQ
jgi:hypothetical protein